MQYNSFTEHTKIYQSRNHLAVIASVFNRVAWRSISGYCRLMKESGKSSSIAAFVCEGQSITQQLLLLVRSMASVKNALTKFLW